MSNNSGDDASLSVLIFIILMVVAICWTNNDTITPNEFALATEVCELNKGISRMELNVTDIDVTCKNGAKFGIEYRHMSSSGTDGWNEEGK